MNIPAHDCSLRKRTQRKSVLLITIIARGALCADVPVLPDPLIS
jgi:hypothetical protein